MFGVRGKLKKEKTKKIVFRLTISAFQMVSKPKTDAGFNGCNTSEVISCDKMRHVIIC